MANISVLRQIVSNVHACFPTGIRKTARLVVSERLSLVKTPMTEGFLKQDLLNTFSNDRVTVLQYYSKVKQQESFKLINKVMKELNITFINKTNQDITESQMLDTLSGLVKAKNAGFKLPKVIKFKNLKKTWGEFVPQQPNIIYLNPNSPSISSSSIHEAAHKNDLGARITRTIPILSIPLKLPGLITARCNRAVISKELGNHAYLDREEFIACTAQKLIVEDKQWSDLDPKIKKLYDFLMGPKLNLKQSN